MRCPCLLVTTLATGVFSVQVSSCDASLPDVFTHEAASLRLGGANPFPTDLIVPIRNRPHLTYSWHSELPDHIGSPTSATFPLVAHAGGDEGLLLPLQGSATSIAAYAMASRTLLEARLAKHGAVLLRGLPLTNGTDYSEFITALGWNVVKLQGGGTQRSDLFTAVRSASDEPPQQTIEPHGDMAHSVTHPSHIAFFCAAGPPAGAGGETALTDMRGVHRMLEAAGVVAEFAARGGIMYHKRLWSSTQTNHTSYTWQKFFFTEDLEVALAAIRKQDPKAVAGEHGTEVIDFHEVLPAVRPHPLTGEPMWFNGAHINHMSYYDEAEHVDTSDGSPMTTTYADGTLIPESMLALIRKAYWSNSVAVRMQTGDVVVVDNYLAHHGRMSWVPPAPRRVLLTHFDFLMPSA